MAILIDLHTHSHFSDGSDSPTHLVTLAAKAGCSAIALTDHDTVRGVPEARTAAEQHGLELIAGVELSCHTEKRTVHILGYFLDIDDARLQERLESQRTLRDERNVQLVAQLNGLGLAITIDEVLELAGEESVGRPHVAAALLARRYVASIDEAFRRFLIEGTPGFVARRELSVEEGIRWITEAGGVASLAHPIMLQRSTHFHIEEELAQLKAAGLHGIECHYGRYDPAQRRLLVKAANRWNLVATGGSDYHGTYKPDLSVGTGRGDLHVPEESLEQLRQRIPS